MDRKRMKRFLAMLLCVTQMVGFAPHVHAEATPDEAQPEHTHSYVAGEPVVTTSYTKTETGHALVTTTTTPMACECGETADDDVQTETGSEEAHTYTDGKCVCGAEEPHIHSYVASGDPTVVVTYDKTSDTHAKTTTTTTKMVCDCGEVGEDNVETVTDDAQAHTYTDGKCTVCDADCPSHDLTGGTCATCGMACVHDWTNKNGNCSVCNYECEHGSEERVGDSYEEKTYTINEDNSHTVVTEIKQEFRCNFCGESYVKNDGGGSGTERHSYDSTGLCACGKQLELCAGEHESVDSGRSVNRLSDITSNNNGTHSYQADTYMYYKCWECGLEWTDSHEYNVTKTDSCDYENGVCTACGYVNSCDHTGYVTLVETWNDWSEGALWADDKNGTTHSVNLKVMEEYKCENCGEGWSEDTGTYVTETENHSYYEGACGACGVAEPTGEECAHTKVEWVTDRDYGDNTVTANDGLTHSGMATVEEYSVCQECGETIESTTEDRIYSETHDYMGTSDVCEICGYQTLCEHESQETREIEFPDEVTRDDDDTHTGTYVYCTETYCLLCGEMVSYTDDITIEKTGPHIYNDGVCVCGDESGCEHTNLSPESWVENHRDVTVIDGENHSFIVDRYTRNVCDDCGETLYENTVEKGVTLTEAHTFNASGKCIYCEYEETNDCEHPSESVDRWSEYALVGDSQWTDNGDGTHYATAYQLYYWECEACGESGSTEEGPQVYYLAHHYQDDVCIQCGVQNPCAHENTESWQERYKLSDYEAVDAVNHQYTADVYEVVWCHDCYSQVSETLISAGTVIVGEHYSEESNGICDFCGFESLCDHPQVEEYEYYRLVDNATAVDEQTHKGIYELVKEKYCLVCDTSLEDEVIQENIERVDNHYFYDGECNNCGYVNDCEHVNGVYEVPWCEEKKDVEYIDAKTHSYIAIMHTDYYCNDCDEYLDEKTVITSDVFVTEEHKLNSDGVCVVCSGQITQPATPTPVPTPTPTPAPTATPTPTPEPEEDDEEEDYFVPTPRPNTNTNYRPAATAEPTAEPTPVPTAEPTPVPTVAPAYTEPEMVSTLVSSIAAAEAEGSTVTIEIVGAQEVFTEEEHQQLKQLPVAEQVLVTLSTIGFADVVDAAMATMTVTLSDNAAQIVTQANATMEKMTEVEREEMQKTIEKSFPKTQVQIDGVVYDYFILEMEIVVDGVARIESYGFRYDEALGQWIFVKMDTLGVDNAA